MDSVFSMDAWAVVDEPARQPARRVLVEAIDRVVYVSVERLEHLPEHLSARRASPARGRERCAHTLALTRGEADVAAGRRRREPKCGGALGERAHGARGRPRGRCE